METKNQKHGDKKQKTENKFLEQNHTDQKQKHKFKKRSTKCKNLSQYNSFINRHSQEWGYYWLIYKNDKTLNYKKKKINSNENT